MSHFGRSGPPDIRDTYSLLILNISFRTNADVLFPLFDKYGKVVDIFVPRHHRTREPRGFAFVRYKYRDEAQRAVERLDGRLVDGRVMAVQFAKYGPSERIHKGRITEKVSKVRGRSRSRSPRRRYRVGYARDRVYRRRSRSRSVAGYECSRCHESGQHRYRSRSYSISPDYDRGRGRRRYYDERRSRSRSFDRYRVGYARDRVYRRRSRSRSVDGYECSRCRECVQCRYRSRSYSRSPDYDSGRGRRRYYDERRSRSISFDSERSLSPTRTSPSDGDPIRRSLSLLATPGSISPD